MKRILEAPSRRVANIFNEVDTNFIEICNTLANIMFPGITLQNYAEQDFEPTNPDFQSGWLVKETGTLWGISVEKNDIVAFNGTGWETLPYKITGIGQFLQDNVGGQTASDINFQYHGAIPNANNVQTAIEDLIQKLVNDGVITDTWTQGD